MKPWQLSDITSRDIEIGITILKCNLAKFRKVEEMYRHLEKLPWMLMETSPRGVVRCNLWKQPKWPLCMNTLFYIHRIECYTVDKNE